MVKYIPAPEGKKWTLTEFGFEQSRIRAKYEKTACTRKQYEKIVPQQWLEKGYVRLTERREDED